MGQKLIVPSLVSNTRMNENMDMSCSLYLCKAYSAYTSDKLAEAICRSYVGINQVLVLKEFINRSESIGPHLNKAAKTDGECLLSGCSVWPILLLCTLYALRLPALHWLPVLPFCHWDMIHLGRTVNVGICECKPDAMAQVWGDTPLRPRLEMFVIWLYMMLVVCFFVVFHN